jgi:predicted MFS family arabinose efflux permease
MAAALGLMAVLDAASALTSGFPVLLALRAGAGACAGVLTWLAWADAMRHPASMRDVAAVGPVTALLAAPLMGWLAGIGGDRALYWVLAVSPLAAIALPMSFGEPARTMRDSMSPSRSNHVLLLALAIMTMAGAALFVFVGALARDQIGMGGLALSLGFSLHSLAGLIGARYPLRPGRAWPWIGLTALSATALVILPDPTVFYVAMITWGFGFWMAVPGVLDSLAAWSFVREERVGDAQGVMAAGRAVGPALGGAIVGTGAFLVLGLVAGAGLAVAAALVAAVEYYRRDRSAPTAP